MFAQRVSKLDLEGVLITSNVGAQLTSNDPFLHASTMKVNNMIFSPSKLQKEPRGPNSMQIKDKGHDSELLKDALNAAHQQFTGTRSPFKTLVKQ